MTSSRSPGRYNLHRLGWNAFEDLCMQVMRVVLGETCSRFRPGADRGRDGWYTGQASVLLSSQNKMAGQFVVQCKHTSSAHNPLTAADLTNEIEKVRTLAATRPCHYILMTNRQVSAPSEEAIRLSFEALPGVGRCLILHETWIEDTVDANPRLLRLVPRLYGIGDLSQILSFTLAQQTAALFEDLASSLRTFVPTDSYRRAERAFHEHRFVVLVGPPASGKSAIAANLCMVSMAQDADVRVLRIEHAEQFKDTWSPADPRTIYWVDDVFGETTLDDARLREWSAALDKVESARRRDSRIIFCTRDYILSAAERKLKRSKADIINDARVRVDVTALSTSEREAIMYNHIKDGDISQKQKGSLKKHLPMLARLSSFSPELARRLGSRRFHTWSSHTPNELRAFFDRPVQHFRDVIQGLSGPETAALAVCLLSGNTVPDPVPDSALTEVVLRTYSVTMHQVREAIELLEGSLVKRVRQATKQTWQVHHPSMIEALQEELASKSSQLLLYLQGALLPTILRDTTTLPPPHNSRLVFLPDTVYPILCDRLSKPDRFGVDAVGEYLAARASDSLLKMIEGTNPALLDRVLALAPEPEGADAAPRLAVRLDQVADASLLTTERQALVRSSLEESVADSGWLGFLKVEGLRESLPGFVDDFLAYEVDEGFPSLSTNYDWHAQDLSERPHVESALEAMEAHTNSLLSELSSAGLLSNELEHALHLRRRRLESRLEERLAEIGKSEDQRDDHMHDEWKEQYYEERYELEHGRFADVDE